MQRQHVQEQRLPANSQKPGSSQQGPRGSTALRSLISDLGLQNPDSKLLWFWALYDSRRHPPSTPHAQSYYIQDKPKKQAIPSLPRASVLGKVIQVVL